MKTQFRLPVLAVALVAALAGCTTYQTTRDTTQPSKLQKAAFADGPWYTVRTVIDAPYEAGFTFIGEAGGMEKIQWDIQEDYIYAYKTYEFIQGTDATAKSSGGDSFRGEPVAAYRVESHFDLWHRYNSITGEELPVLYEAQERPWYEREYFRVDWSANLVKSFDSMGSTLCSLGGSIAKSPIAYTPSKPGDPQAVYFAERSADGTWTNHYDLTQTQHLSKIDYIDVINREFDHINVASFFSLFGPDIGCIGYPYMPIAEDMQITYRQSFMKMDKAQYAQFEPVYYPDPSFEKFGFFRDERLHYDANRGVTDFLGYQMHRWNIWQKTKDDSGKTIPMASREVKKITYYIPDVAPANFQKIAASEIAGKSWNLAFQDALSAAHWKGGAAGAKVADTTMFEIKPTDKNCGLDGQQECQQLGDLRYSFANYVARPNMGSPLGYGPSFSDPETGEIIMASANFYGAALDTMRGYVGDVYDLTENPGSATETSILTGENVRKYFQGLGNVVPPTFPNVRFDPNLLPAGNSLLTDGQFNPAAFSPQMLKIKNILDTMKRDGPGSLYSADGLKDTPIEKMLVESDGYLRLFGYGSLDEVDPSAREELLNKISPLRNNGFSTNYNKMTDFWSRSGTWSTRDGVPTQGCSIPADALFDDASIPALVTEARQALKDRGLDDVAGTGDEIADPQKGDVIDWIMLHTFRGVEEHEIGHTFGLRHNFEGTADEENYQPEYWSVVNDPELKLPQPGDFDANSDHNLEFDEWQTYLAAYNTAHAKQEAAGVNFHEYSSIMDYSMHFYYNDTHGIGKYDHAAIKFGYANTVEAYSSPVIAPDKSNRTDIPYFLGGETCTVSTDCPEHNAFVINGKTYVQHCRGSADLSTPPVQTTLGQGRYLDTADDEAKYLADTGQSGGVCSDVFTELSAGNVVNETTGIPTGESAQVSFPNYRFCSDERVQDRPFCTRYDEGRNAVEVVQNQIQEYERSYIFSNFRRYRYSFGINYPSRIFSRFFMPLGKIYQSMLYQYYYNPDFRQSPDKGFTDFLQASVLSLNFFGRVLAEPAVGQFQQLGDITTPPGQTQNVRQKIARWTGSEICGTNTNDIQPCIDLGYGKYLWSSWEKGYYGIDRMARVGTFYDKLVALEALSTRDWGFPRFSDETYPINFYDGFRDELLQMFGGMATENLPAYAGLAKTDADGNVNSLQYRNFWTGKFFNTDARNFGIEVGGLQFGCDDPKGEACQGMIAADFPQTMYDQGYRPVDPGGSFILRLQSLIYAVQSFSPYYDQTFPGYVQLSVFGQADARDPDIDAAVAAGKMVQYVSPQFNKSYTASRSQDGKSFTAQMVGNAADLASLRKSYLAATDLGPLNSDPRCVLQSPVLTNEDCRQELVNWTDNDINNTETLLNFTDFVLKVTGGR